MIKLSASLSKKIPITGLSYSSQSFMAGLEVEISEQSSNSQICTRMQELYQMLEDSINEQIGQHEQNNSQQKYPRRTNSEKACPTSGTRQSRRNAQTKNYTSRQKQGSQQNRNEYPASQAQQKAIAAIIHEHQLDDGYVAEILEQNFQKSETSALSMKEASSLISLLNSQLRPAG